MITIKAKSDSDHFIVQKDGAFFLVDLLKGEAIQSQPPDKPDIFLKWGWFEDVTEVDAKTQAEIDEAMNHIRTLPPA